MKESVQQKLAQRFVSVDLGCGSYKRGDIGIDFSNAAGDIDIVCNIGFEPLPLPEGSVDKCFAYDFLEHLPKAVYDRSGGKWSAHRPHLFLFNEVFRVLKPGGEFETMTPVCEPEVSGRALHVSQWNEETLYCFASRGFPEKSRMIWELELPMMRWHGYTADFELVELRHVEGIPGRLSHARAIFKAIKSGT